jgi:hypothetical protein
VIVVGLRCKLGGSVSSGLWVGGGGEEDLMWSWLTIATLGIDSVSLGVEGANDDVDEISKLGLTGTCNWRVRRLSSVSATEAEGFVLSAKRVGANRAKSTARTLWIMIRGLHERRKGAAHQRETNGGEEKASRTNDNSMRPGVHDMTSQEALRCVSRAPILLRMLERTGGVRDVAFCAATAPWKLEHKPRQRVKYLLGSE